MTTISDIDGTLLRSGIYPIPAVIKKVNASQPVVIVTGRPESQRERTAQSLRTAGIKYVRLLMCPDGEDQYASKIKHARDVNATIAYDNDAKVRAGYENIGIKAVDPATVR